MKRINLIKYTSLFASLITILTAIAVIYLERTNFISQIRNLIFSENKTVVDTTAIHDTTAIAIPDSITSKLNVIKNFYPSGYIGDASLEKYVQINNYYNIKPYSEPSCVQVVYNRGSMGWAGIYWQTNANNWGDNPGIDLSNKGYNKISFWVKGEKGGEVVEFKAGGITGKKYKDSFSVSTGRIVLSNKWQKYIIPIKNKNLSNVIGAFCWISTSIQNPAGLTFYLDDVFYEY
ncbi:MAG: hypothetical protein GF353_26855 [Candidatus Lokiarchaeota archaeon]|nr:hypothetical protein [Candidatus Lokiarchaeota archaeon]